VDQHTNDELTKTDPGTLMGNLFRSFWLPVLLESELAIPGCPPVQVRLLGEDLVAFWEPSGEMGLIDALCAHRSAPLFLGRCEEGGLRCIYHGWKFAANGQCIDQPNEPPDSRFKEHVRLKAYPLARRGGVIWTYMGPDAVPPPLPDFDWALVPESHRFIAKYIVDANYLQNMEGDIDSSHGSFLHSALGSDVIEGAHLNRKGYKYEKYLMKSGNPRFFCKDTNTGVLIGARRPAEDDSWYWRITQWLLPAYSLIPEEPHHAIICNMRIPIDDEHNVFFRIRWHPERPLSEFELYQCKQGGVLFSETEPGSFRLVANKQNDYLIDRTVQSLYTYSGIKSIPVQDVAVQGALPIIDRTREHLGSSDLGIVTVRKRLLAAATALRDQGSISAPRLAGEFRVFPVATVLKRETEFSEGADESLHGRDLSLVSRSPDS